MIFLTFCLHWIRFVFRWTFYFPLEVVARVLLTFGVFIAGCGIAFLAACFAAFCFVRRD